MHERCVISRCIRRCLPLIWQAGLLFFPATAAYASTACGSIASITQASRDSQPLARLSALGRTYEANKQYGCAAEAYAKAFALEPDSSALAFRWGWNLHAAGDDLRSLDALNRARSLDPNNLQIHLTLAMVLDRLSRRSESEAEWRAALSIDPASRVALDALSNDLMARNDYPGVIALLGKRSQGSQFSISQTVAFATALAAVARLDDAVQVLRNGLVAHPQDLPIARQLAMVLMIMDRQDEALKVFETALRSHPRDLKTGTMYLQTLVLNKSKEAAEQARRLLALHPDDWQVLYLSAVVDDRAARLSVARHRLERSLALNPTYAPTHAELGKVLQQLGEPARAKAELEKAEALGDKELDVHYQLARVLQSLGEKDSAKQKFQEVEELDAAGINSSRATLQTTAGDQEMAKGNAKKAAEFYREALAATPDDGVLHYKLAKSFELLNDVDSEKAELQRSILLNPNLAEAQNQLGYLAVRAGDARESEDFFRNALKASPSYLAAWVNLAAALASEAKWHEAQDAVDGALRLNPHDATVRQLQAAIQEAQNTQ
jgi:Flp pilus assembly protein TadD